MFSATRRRLRPRSLRARLTLWYLLLLGGTLASLAVFVFLSQVRSHHLELDTELRIRAHHFAAEHLPALLRLDAGRALAEQPRVAATEVAIRRRSGALVFRSPAFPELDWAGERRAVEAARKATRFVSAAGPSGSAIRIVTIPVRRTGDEDLVVQMAGSTAPARSALRHLAAGMALFVVLALSIASFGGDFLARRALAPVEEIVQRVSEVQSARLGDRLDLRPGSRELERLVRTLNGMLDRIEASLRTARRFAADASHELQTPIAAMRAVVETCLRDPGPLDREMAADLLAEIDRLSILVRDLRLLALAESGRLFDTLEPVDLAELGEECAEIARGAVEGSAVSVETAAESRPVVMGSALHLRRVVLNLLLNAARYSPAGSRIVLSVRCVDRHAAVAVRDQGCGIPPEDLAHIFEPFYRADPARARDSGGTGLGLAIVDQVVRLHGGRVSVSSAIGKGSTFTVWLPLGSAAAPGRARPPASLAEPPSGQMKAS